MKKSLIYGTFILIALASNVLSSPPLEERYTTFTQADGSEVKLARYGDARFHWLETRAGEVVIKNPDTGDYEYAKIKKADGRPMLAPSGIRIGQDQKAKASGSEKIAKDFTPVTRKDLIPLRKAATKKYKKMKPLENNR